MEFEIQTFTHSDRTQNLRRDLARFGLASTRVLGVLSLVCATILTGCVNKVENGKTYVDDTPYGLIEKGQTITVINCGPKHAGGPGVDGEMVDVCDVEGSLLPIPKGVIQSYFSDFTP